MINVDVEVYDETSKFCGHWGKGWSMEYCNFLEESQTGKTPSKCVLFQAPLKEEVQPGDNPVFAEIKCQQCLDAINRKKEETDDH